MELEKERKQEKRVGYSSRRMWSIRTDWTRWLQTSSNAERSSVCFWLSSKTRINLCYERRTYLQGEYNLMMFDWNILWEIVWSLPFGLFTKRFVVFVEHFADLACQILTIRSLFCVNFAFVFPAREWLVSTGVDFACKYTEYFLWIVISVCSIGKFTIISLLKCAVVSKTTCAWVSAYKISIWETNSVKISTLLALINL